MLFRSKTTENEVKIEVDASSVAEFLESEAQDRIKLLDDVGPFGEHQVLPFITHKQNIPIYIVLILCLLSHVWARATIGL